VVTKAQLRAIHANKDRKFTVKGERIIIAIKKSNSELPKSKRVNPFAIATSKGQRLKGK
jgi:hypothetical protein